MILISKRWVIKLGLTVRRRQKTYQCPCKASCYTWCQPLTFLHTRMHSLWSHPCFVNSTPALVSKHNQHVSAIHKKMRDTAETQHAVELKEYVKQKCTCFLFSTGSLCLHHSHPKPNIMNADWNIIRSVDSPLSRRSVCFCAELSTQPLRSLSLPLWAGVECV